jgi:hypothetical protein
MVRMLHKIIAAWALVVTLALAGCASPPASSGNYHLAQGAWTCQEPDAIAGIEQADRGGTPDADAVQQHRCTRNPVNWPAHVMRVDGSYAYVCDAFSGCGSDRVFCQYALVADIRDAQNRPADPATLLSMAQQGSLQSLRPASKAMCPAS